MDTVWAGLLAVVITTILVAVILVAALLGALGLAARDTHLEVWVEEEEEEK